MRLHHRIHIRYVIKPFLLLYIIYENQCQKSREKHPTWLEKRVELGLGHQLIVVGHVLYRFELFSFKLYKLMIK